MPLQLDHVVIAVHDLDAAIQNYRDLGFTVVRGRVHANRATHNALITFSDGTYLELLALTGEMPIPDNIDFSVLVTGTEGFVGFALRSDDLEADAARLRSEGFAVGDVIPGERQRADGTIIQWKLALLNDGFAPFLIEDITPRVWRIPHDPAATTHANRAIGLGGVEIAVRDMAASKEIYTKLIGAVPRDSGSNFCKFDDITLRLIYEDTSRYTLTGDDWPSHLKMFGGNVPHVEIDTADPAFEPANFEEQRRQNAEKRVAFRREAAREQGLLAALQEHPAVLSAVGLTREAGVDDHFTPERTHGVYFRQIIGTPPTRGSEILIGIESIHWKTGGRLAPYIPDYLRGLTSNNAAVRGYSLDMLGDALIHQGDVCEIAFDVAPFLIRLLEAPEIENKVELVALLEGIVSGFIKPHQREQLQTLLRDLLPVYLKLSDHIDPLIQRVIARQLYFYGSEVDVLAPVLQARITSEPDPAVRTECVGALAALWTGAPERWMIAAEEKSPRKLSEEQTAYFGELMRDAAQPPAVRYRAARALLRDDPGMWLDTALQLLDRLMRHDVEVIRSLSDDWVGGVFHDLIEILPEHLDQVLEWTVAQAQHSSADVRQQVSSALTRLVQSGQPVERVIPVVVTLMRDPSPDVRQSAVGFFYNKPYAAHATGVLQALAAHDPSLTVRTVAGHTLRVSGLSGKEQANG
jgi:catechol 2,3-dioxygenase-like lactoylglutathione lyase family enzyme